MDIRSVTHVTRNEDGFEEVEVEYNPTFAQWLFRKPGTVRTWVAVGDTWVDKNTKVPVDGKDWLLIYVLKSEIKSNMWGPV